MQMQDKRRSICRQSFTALVLIFYRSVRTSSTVRTALVLSASAIGRVLLPYFWEERRKGDYVQGRIVLRLPSDLPRRLRLLHVNENRKRNVCKHCEICSQKSS